MIAEISAEHEPLLITQHGQPPAYLVDIQTYEAMESRSVMLEGLAKSEKAIQDGRTISHNEAKTRMARWLD